MLANIRVASGHLVKFGNAKRKQTDSTARHAYIVCGPLGRAGAYQNTTISGVRGTTNIQTSITHVIHILEGHRSLMKATANMLRA